MDSPHPFHMNRRTTTRTIVPQPMNNGATFCPPWRLKITGEGMWPRSRGLKPPMQSLLIMTATNVLWRLIRRRRGLVSYQAINSTKKDSETSRGSELLNGFQEVRNAQEKVHVTYLQELFWQMILPEVHQGRAGRRLG